MKIGCEERLWDKLTNAIYLGSEEWTKKMRKLVESKPRYDAHPRTQRAVGRPTMHAIIQTISHQAKVPHQTIRSRGGRSGVTPSLFTRSGRSGVTPSLFTRAR
ncbi:MAG TPA: hypothetical protein VF701_00930 [Thermoanaerobaculia bacterium]